MEDDRQQDSTDLIGELIRRGGRRERPTDGEYDRVFAAATIALQAKIRQRRRRTAFGSLAAAVLIGVATTTFILNRPGAVPQPLASTDRVVGPVEVRQGEESWAELNAETMPLFVDSRVRTGPGSRLGVRMANGVSFRLAESTDVVFEAPDRVRLLSGKVYADAEEASVNDGKSTRYITVETVVGRAWDIGTQFEVQYVGGIYRLRVREGQVNVQQETRELQGMAGEQLIIDSAQRVQVAHIASDDSEWQWTETVAPDPVIDARSVSVLVNWVARQTGRTVTYARPGLELEAATTLMYGRVYHLDPLEALDAMLATTDFNFTLLMDGTILIDYTP